MKKFYFQVHLPVNGLFKQLYFCIFARDVLVARRKLLKSVSVFCIEDSAVVIDCISLNRLLCIRSRYSAGDNLVSFVERCVNFSILDL